MKCSGNDIVPLKFSLRGKIRPSMRSLVGFALRIERPLVSEQVAELTGNIATYEGDMKKHTGQREKELWRSCVADLSNFSLFWRSGKYLFPLLQEQTPCLFFDDSKL
eukprot:5663812-Amphidinium_carterae.1